MTQNKKTELATFGMGCFWHSEEAFREVPGVVRTTVGYMGGSMDKPTYEDVCTDKTGHVEVVEVEYDPSKVTYDELLERFWQGHDPTTKDRQGPDVGTQYRSVVFYHTDKQRAAAEQSKNEQSGSGKYPVPVITAVEPAQTFFEAEEYHQKYLMKRGKKVC